METKEYVRFIKYAGVAGVVMFVVGLIGEVAGRLILTDLPHVADKAFIYMLGVGIVAVFVSIILGGVLPLALE